MRRPVALVLVMVALLPVAARAHSYPDPAIVSVLDGLSPSLPSGVLVELRPSVLDELVLTNPTERVLEVLGRDGVPFLRVSKAGVLANLANPDWYLTALPEGSPRQPEFAAPQARPRWARVSTGSTWAEFDPRVRPPVEVTRELREAGQRRILATWTIPLRYDGQPVEAAGRVLLSPVRGGLVVAVTRPPTGLGATPLQGELPGLFLSVPAATDVLVEGRDGLPFLRFSGNQVLANQASATWREDQRARGKLVAGTGWLQVGTGLRFSWLDGRLRYPGDEPPENAVRRRSVVQRWEIPVTVAGRPEALTGTVTWVPRADALREVLPGAEDAKVSPWWWGVLVLLLPLGFGWRRRFRRNEEVHKAGNGCKVGI